MKIFFTISFLIIMAFTADAQRRGEIIVHQPEIVDILISKHREFIDQVNTVPGYRIQVLSTTRLAEAENAKAAFVMTYNNIPAHIDFSSPYYKLKVGDFRNRGDAYVILKKVREKYPDSIIVKDRVKLLEVK